MAGAKPEIGTTMQIDTHLYVNGPVAGWRGYVVVGDVTVFFADDGTTHTA